VATVLSVLSARSVRFRSLLCGRPSVVVENGIVLEKELRKNRLTVDELMEELRIQGCPDFRDVKYAVLETNGQLSVLPKAANKPPVNFQLGRTPPDEELPVVVISDGKVLEGNLRRLGHDRRWLEAQLKEVPPSALFLVLADSSGLVYQSGKGALL
jgi:uncharacterized membrane protein YcaP (DUF421 family)